MNPTLSSTQLDRLARKRAGAKLGWYVHATVYVAVNALLAGLSSLSSLHGQHWAVFPALGWGLGLLVHGVVVFGVMPGSALYERLLSKERQRLVAQRDPW